MRERAGARRVPGRAIRTCARVHYPGLAVAPAARAARRRCSARPARCCRSSSSRRIDCFEFLNRLRVVVLSSNLGDNRTLAIPVAQTIFWEMGAARRAEMGIADSLIRVSVGIEDGDDLIADFAQALGLTRQRQPPRARSGHNDVFENGGRHGQSRQAAQGTEKAEAAEEAGAEDLTGAVRETLTLHGGIAAEAALARRRAARRVRRTRAASR